MERPSPDEIQPPVTLWGHVWRTLLMLSISALVWSSVAEAQWEDHRALFWIEVGLAVPSYILVFWRRRWPLAIALGLTALSAISGLSAGPATLAAVSLATRRRLWQVGLIAVFSIVCAQTFAVTQPTPDDEPYWLTLSVNVTITAAILAWGMYIGSRRELIWTLRYRAERAESEQELRIEQARSKERARIAREMHDVLAHRISQISMHAGALAFRDDLAADDMRASAAVIQQQAHEALTDLRGVLGVLRDSTTGELQNKPQPTYADLPRLVAEAQASGVHVEYTDWLQTNDDHVPDAVGRTVYRIVQEGITNARKHAPGARLTIQVTGSPEDGVDILLRNPVGFVATSTPGAGLGLIGLSERAGLRGGRLEHRRDGSTFVLHGWIPWAA